MLDEHLRVKILFEMEQIDKLLSSAKVLIDECRIIDPDFIQLAACAAVLHSFYTGVESIFILTAKNIDKNIIKEERWHKYLLDQMAQETKKRKALISSDVKELLIEYMEFRHFFRHAYSFNLDWSKMKRLTHDLLSVWDRVKKEILEFM